MRRGRKESFSPRRIPVSQVSNRLIIEKDCPAFYTHSPTLICSFLPRRRSFVVIVHAVAVVIIGERGRGDACRRGVVGIVGINILPCRILTKEEGTDEVGPPHRIIPVRIIT